MIELMFYSKGTKFGKNVISNWAEICCQRDGEKIKKTFIPITKIKEIPIFVDVFDSNFVQIREEDIADLIEENHAEVVFACNRCFFNQAVSLEDDVKFILFENGRSFHYIIDEERSALLFAED